MDTTTVLEIIKMIDRSIKTIRDNYPDEGSKRTQALYELQEHLQSFIEAQLNAVELKTGE